MIPSDGSEKETIQQKTILNEKESKQFLKEYGIPVINESVAITENDVLKTAIKIGFPVVVKGLGQGLSHKTESGLVHLHLADSDSVLHAARSIASKTGNQLEGFLVQPQIEGRREFVAGLFQDEQFGPVVMFGLGGIFTEALSDITFRLAPLSEAEANEMLNEIKARSLLDDFRGEKAVNRHQIIQTLMGLSRISVETPSISEVDINPLIATRDGSLFAVDALVIKMKTAQKNEFQPPVDPKLLGYFFHPRSIAFVGASSQMGKWGHMLFTLTASGGFEGGIYLVNHKGGTIAGRHVYKSVVEIPDNVDMAVVTIPASAVRELIPQFKKKKIKNMLLITSGFKETGQNGKKMEEKLVKEARNAGILVLGPNTMGICNPHIHLYCTGSHVRPIPGSTVVVSQSGNMGTQLLAFAEQQGIGIRGFCGSGNEAMISVEDFLDAFENDALTRTVMLYLESVRNGRRFFESARRVGKKKPIVLLKGGRSRAGTRAAISHTGALSLNSNIFNTVCRQAGIVQVEQPMDLLDLSAAFSSLPLPKGNRVAVMTLGGGWGVITADLCSEYGLEVPELTPDIVEHLDHILPPYWSRSNPVDLVGERDPSIPMTAIEALVKWDGCDAIINLGILGRNIFLKRLSASVLKVDPDYSPDFLDKLNEALSKFEQSYIVHIIELMEKHKKPIFGVSLISDEKDQTVYRMKEGPYKGIFFPTPERAVKACAKMFEYQRFLYYSRL